VAGKVEVVTKVTRVEDSRCGSGFTALVSAMPDRGCSWRQRQGSQPIFAGDVVAGPESTLALGHHFLAAGIP
jgi:hypothetical protein